MDWKDISEERIDMRVRGFEDIFFGSATSPKTESEVIDVSETRSDEVGREIAR
jgi:hypothetical protein